MTSNKMTYSEMIKAEAQRLGFTSCGISKAEFLEEEAPRLENWLNANHQAGMSYMENHFDKRLDPRLLVDGAQSVISLLFNYYPEPIVAKDSYKVSKYAYGEDYHFVVKDKLTALLDFINQEIGEVSGRAFVDSAPVLERAWAKRSGLGWIGKNANLITKKQGSFYFISELIVDLPLEYDTSIATDHCGSCTACLDACPTNAIKAPYLIDSNSCISYLTIELKGELPSDLNQSFDDWIFGCDICQDVCPWNRFSITTKEERFAPNPYVNYSKAQWQELTAEVFSEIARKSPLKRTKFSGITRNLQYVNK
ncbi:MAG: tRNA epoxyqueuosine(34) reductase QueG [Flavobacteriaceae bacterium]|jgi:epoxyqueuosine reductase|nr:tRNA epoxyqueuosine(34) reductase QueG [Flavobacteriaceae bacterium]NVJ73021.1 tRNA epoxyqueuosine(34) reductase QueG [Flavobacteriaceae bacterium]